MLAERARREAERRGITLKEFVDDALRRFLASEEHCQRGKHPGLGWGGEGRPTA